MFFIRILFKIKDIIFSFFLCSSKERTKEKTPEKTTSPVCRQLRYAISRSDKHGEVRAFSGSLSHPTPFSEFFLSCILSDNFKTLLQ
jgi:hypothetical protein